MTLESRLAGHCYIRPVLLGGVESPFFACDAMAGQEARQAAGAGGDALPSQGVAQLAAGVSQHAALAPDHRPGRDP
ncbi:hypothetical protein VP06_18055 [Methylobacterium aquaticum]|uniref:Uncharacterized protein n=1 Tax=Methylobacterium aquaticum TaxID=270351 RepID=A0A0J6V0B9_9HYPH|nr:hypothetical protein VP06_18055 [Methylobacterium aquaticum]